jgi:hypothetical protein
MVNRVRCRSCLLKAAERMRRRHAQKRAEREMRVAALEARPLEAVGA